MESQPQNPEFRINPENFHTCIPIGTASANSAKFCEIRPRMYIKDLL